MHASPLIKPGHILVRSESDLDYYPGQWVIRVSDSDPVSTLMHTVVIRVATCDPSNILAYNASWNNKIKYLHMYYANIIISILLFSYSYSN